VIRRQLAKLTHQPAPIVKGVAKNSLMSSQILKFSRNESVGVKRLRNFASADSIVQRSDGVLITFLIM
jgi:hypothetical protein